MAAEGHGTTAAAIAQRIRSRLAQIEDEVGCLKAALELLGPGPKPRRRRFRVVSEQTPAAPRELVRAPETARTAIPEPPKRKAAADDVIALIAAGTATIPELRKSLPNVTWQSIGRRLRELNAEGAIRRGPRGWEVTRDENRDRLRATEAVRSSFPELDVGLRTRVAS
jgi:hypothetical protein